MIPTALAVNQTLFDPYWKRPRYQCNWEQSDPKEANEHVPLDPWSARIHQKETLRLQSDTMASCDDAKEQVSSGQDESECIDRPRRQWLIRRSDISPRKE